MKNGDIKLTNGLVVSKNYSNLMPMNLNGLMSDKLIKCA
jgi:hypothetical protein